MKKALSLSYVLKISIPELQEYNFSINLKLLKKSVVVGFSILTILPEQLRRLPTLIAGSAA